MAEILYHVHEDVRRPTVWSVGKRTKDLKISVLSLYYDVKQIWVIYLTREGSGVCFVCTNRRKTYSHSTRCGKRGLTCVILRTHNRNYETKRNRK